MGLVRIEPPETSPVSVEEARRQCRIVAGDTNFDGELETYIAAAVSHLEGPDGILGGLCLEPQVWEYVVDSFTDAIQIPLRPVISIDSIAYLDADGVSQALDAENFTTDLSSSSAWVVRNSSAGWPTTLDGINAVRVRFTAGFEETEAGDSGVPAALKQSILLLVGWWFSQRESGVIGQTVSTVPLAFDALTSPYRRYAV